MITTNETKTWDVAQHMTWWYLKKILKLANCFVMVDECFISWLVGYLNESHLSLMSFHYVLFQFHFISLPLTNHMMSSDKQQENILTRNRQSGYTIHSNIGNGSTNGLTDINETVLDVLFGKILTVKMQ